VGIHKRDGLKGLTLFALSDKRAAPCANRRPPDDREPQHEEGPHHGDTRAQTFRPAWRAARSASLSGLVMVPGPVGPAAVRVAAVVPVILLVLFIGLLWLLGLMCGRDRRRYVTNLSQQAMAAIGVLLHGPADISRLPPRNAAPIAAGPDRARPGSRAPQR